MVFLLPPLSGDVGPGERDGGSLTDKFNVHIAPLVTSADPEAELNQVN